jgi:hypothetical protein
MSEAVEIKVPVIPDLKFTRADGTVLFTASVMKMRTLLLVASAGISSELIDYNEIQASRMANAIKEDFGVDVTDTEAYIISAATCKKLRDIEQSF